MSVALCPSQRHEFVRAEVVLMPSDTVSITVEEARKDILKKVSRNISAVQKPLRDIVGCILAQDVASPIAVPAYTNSAMDGFAFKASDLRGKKELTLTVAGTSYPGHPYKERIKTGQCVKITTGGAVPAGCDTVIAFEKVTDKGDTVTFDTAVVRKGDNLRLKGEEVTVGQTVLAKGIRINPAHVAVLASLGYSEAMIYEPFRVGLIATGDELISPGRPCPPERLYNANSHFLAALLRNLGVEVTDFGIIRDDPNAIRQAILYAKQNCSLIICTGGAAASATDFTHQVVESLGKICRWTVNMRPGRPMRFAVVERRPLFMLPGNPVAAFVTFLEFVRGTILYMQGQDAPDCWPHSITARAGCDIKKKPGRAEFMRAKLAINAKGVLTATPLKNQGSAATTVLTEADGLIALPHETDFVKKGEPVTVHLLTLLMN